MIDKLAWIETSEGLVLSTRSKGRTSYYLPGGKRELGETDAQTLLREIKEELSVDLDAASLQLMGVFQAQADSHPDGVLVQMTCYTGRYAGTLKPDHEIEELVWLCYKDRDKVSAVDKLIFDWLKGKGLLR
ncbi:NUDIX domain-containing protein [Nibribacter ruber]|uniref:NUDIX domain-containing protein n=1 Tax=Nibribacter ruber TaxID=2698458 RepID=A0A6P1NS39_9BACT|nr:NUDIX domain-containing protein [Nibribacter ruber]QHL86487.1 NUDIX domain-containing protein [Nibribacter ruber]